MIRISPVKNTLCTRAMSASTTSRQVNRPENPTPFCVALRNWMAKLRPNRNEKIVKNLPKVSRCSSFETTRSSGLNSMKSVHGAGPARKPMTECVMMMPNSAIGAQHVDDRDAFALTGMVDAVCMCLELPG